MTLTAREDESLINVPADDPCMHQHPAVLAPHQKSNIGIIELLDHGLQHVPDIYVRPLHDRPSSASSSAGADQIPVINLANLSDTAGRSEVVQEIGRACEKWGFFQVTNHGIQPIVIERLRAVAREFFQQPAEERMRFHTQGFMNRQFGYITSFNPFQEKVRDWRDALYFNRFPGECDGFDEAPDFCKQPLLEYIEELEQLGSSIYQAIFESLGLEEKYLEAALPKLSRVALAISYYPPCPDPSLTLGLTAHSDVSCLTILHPDQVPGLQVKRGDTWVSVKPVPNAFVVNLADQIEILTNGMYKSVEHRVVTNEKDPRMSMACFFGPSKDTIISPLPKLMDYSKPSRYKATKFGDYVKNSTKSAMLSNKDTLEFARA